MNNIQKLCAYTYAITACALQSAAYHSQPNEIYTCDQYRILDYTMTVKAQEGADCGLHSIKNSIALYNSLTNKYNEATRNHRLQNDRIANLGNMEQCRELIGVGNRYLDPEELQPLLAQLKGRYSIPIRENKFIILDNLKRPDTPRFSAQNAQLARVIEHLQNGTPFVHAFILGNMNEDGQRAGHWIACVLERKEHGDKLNIHTANSSASHVHTDTDIRLAIQEYNKDLCQQLVQLLNSSDLATLKYQWIEHHKENLQKNINHHNFKAALTDIQELIEEAALNNIFTDTIFQNDILPTIFQSLLMINEEYLSAEDAQLKTSLFELLMHPEEVLTRKQESTQHIQSTTDEPDYISEDEDPIAASSQPAGQGLIRALTSKLSNWWYGAPAQPTASSRIQEADTALTENSDAQLAEQLAFEAEEQERLEADAQAAAAHQLQTYDEDIIDTTESDAELARALAEITD